ncbi:MAG TPA: phage baseplate assembly protein V [Steroidobacteraceae bacterium]|nr:phage baseplate assembly protein V [Steroidobacteraceae bacterium]
MSNKQYVGMYPGRVMNNIDPLNMSRIQVSVADVGGNQILSWALPCLPVAGNNMGMFTVPPIGSGVWVQFARGDIDYPIWLGGYFANGEAPALSRNVPPGISGITLQTQGGNGLVISDAPGGGVLIKTLSGAFIEISQTGITIDNGSGARIEMTGNTVDVNGGALTVR